MKQKQKMNIPDVPRHVGIIPDGNRRYAKLHDMSLEQVYMHGSKVGIEIARSAEKVGIKHMSFFAISSENILCRPPLEIMALRTGVIDFCNKILANKWKLHMVGKIDSLPDPFKSELIGLQQSNSPVGDFVVHVDINYSGDVESELSPLLGAVARCGYAAVANSPKEFIPSANLPPIDLVVRTGGKHRLSGFLPFQTTHSELCFLDCLWGDFTPKMFMQTLSWYVVQEKSKEQ